MTGFLLHPRQFSVRSALRKLLMEFYVKFSVHKTTANLNFPLAHVHFMISYELIQMKPKLFFR